ncbi:MAG: hypothetical protein AB7I27_16135 [Bacteriovoracaceae bacterium]
MNQKGETTLLGVLLLFALSSLLILCQLELRASFRLLQKRTKLFLCTKEAKGELNQYLKTMGRTNWAIKNLNRTKLITMIIPGLQGISSNAQKAKEALIQYQNFQLISYLKTLKQLSKNGCFLDPRMFITPFELSASIYKRDMEGGAILRKNEWVYYFSQKPYALSLQVKAEGYLSPKPIIKYETFLPAENLPSTFVSSF